MTKLKSYFFTFGQEHVHRVAGFTWNCDVVAEIEAFDENHAREIMKSLFGFMWAFSYRSCPDLKNFPRGVKKVLV